MISEALYIIVAICFIVWSLRSTFYWVDFWDQHAYQNFSLTKITYALFSSVFSASNIVSWLTVVLVLVFLINDTHAIFSEIAISILMVGKTLYVLFSEKKRFFPTNFYLWKKSVMVLISLFLISLAFTFPLAERFVWILFIDRILFLIVLLALTISFFPIEIYSDVKVTKAASHITKIKHLSSIIFVGDNSSETVSLSLSLLKDDFNVLPLYASSPQRPEVFDQITSQVSFNTELLLLSVDDAHIDNLLLLMQELHPLFLFLPVEYVGNEKYMRRLHSEVATRSTKIILHGNDFLVKKVLHIANSRKNVSIKTEIVAKAIKLHKRKDTNTIDVILGSRTIQLPISFDETFINQSFLPAIFLSDEMGVSDKKIKTSLKSYFLTD